MRQAIGTTWILQLVIIFMLIFVSFLALSINYTKAFKIKNELTTIIEKYEGLSSGDGGTINIINNYLLYNNYTVKGKCEENEWGVDNLNDTIIKEVNKNEKYYYCIKKMDESTESLPTKAKYKVKIFFNFSLPIIGQLFTFNVDGTTISITNTLDDINMG